jgi:L-seryl-tRNA(Ser) seleniumtransferase
MTGARPPSVERVLVRLRASHPSVGAAALRDAARAVIATERARLRGGAAPASPEALAAEAAEMLNVAGPSVPRVINATGVLIHTNIGRAPWPRAAIAAAEAAAGSLFLELDPATGRRGRRYRAAEDALIELTGAADALVTNNNAAAVALAVGLAGRGGRVVVSRGELVEIGGGVRIPEIIRRAGARLVEVGTTNRTRAADFTEALAAGARVVLRVHPSNFRQSGFIEVPDPIELARIAHEHGAIVIDDLGSGALLDTAPFGLAHEPTPGERLAAGADIVTFSGDKLLGGPQAGLVVGTAELIGRMRRDPLARAMRPDKVRLAALAATLELYRTGRALDEVPVWRMLAARTDGLRQRAEAIRDALPEPARDDVDVIRSEATVGGGALPGETVPSVALALRGRPAERVLARLRDADPAVVGRIAGGRVLLDLRTILPDEDAGVAAAVRGALGGA